MKFILNIILHVAISAGALLLVSKYVPGVHLSGWQTAVVVTFALFVLKYTVKPILAIISLPINLITFGLFSFLINGALFFLVAKYIEGFTVDTFMAGVIGALVTSVVKSFGGYIVDLIF